jgi:hypothetical protein
LREIFTFVINIETPCTGIYQKILKQFGLKKVNGIQFNVRREEVRKCRKIDHWKEIAESSPSLAKTCPRVEGSS